MDQFHWLRGRGLFCALSDLCLPPPKGEKYRYLGTVPRAPKIWGSVPRSPGAGNTRHFCVRKLFKECRNFKSIRNKSAEAGTEAAAIPPPESGEVGTETPTSDCDYCGEYRYKIISLMSAKNFEEAGKMTLGKGKHDQKETQLCQKYGRSI